MVRAGILVFAGSVVPRAPFPPAAPRWALWLAVCGLIACDAAPPSPTDAARSDDARAFDSGLDALVCAQPDADGDGAARIECGGNDCDDADPRRFPGNLELCDYEGHDEDCDPDTFGVKDSDRDGFVDVRCCNGRGGPSEICGNDCDDARPNVRRNASEVCNGLDEDCDGLVDEASTTPVRPDRDRDLHGDEDSLDVMACAGARGFALYGDDCDDGQDAMDVLALTRAQRIWRNAPEIDDDLDNDCDQLVDEDITSIDFYPDDDGDGFGREGSVPTPSDVVLPMHSVIAGDCADDDRSVGPAQVERCNGQDDDCNGVPDYHVPDSDPNDTEDDDADGVPDQACNLALRDCDDRDPEARPGAAERCNGRDDDCDRTVDEDCGRDPDAGVRDAWIADVGGDSGAGPLDSALDARTQGSAEQAIVDVRAAVGTVAPPIEINGGVVSYVRPVIGSDPAGFYVQNLRTGPALFVTASVSPAPSPGDLVSFRVTQTGIVTGHHRVTAVDGFVIVSPAAIAVTTLVQDVSDIDLVSQSQDYEHELITLQAIIANAFVGCANPHVCAQIMTAGVTTPSPSFRMRTDENVSAALPGCTVEIGPSPLWRYNAQTQPSAWQASELRVVSCPADGGVQDLSGLFFSEYMEGSGARRALELYNAGPAAIDLGVAACRIRTYPNGALGAGWTYTLSGSIPSGATLTVCNSSLMGTLSGGARCDLWVSSPAVDFDGNDAIDLICGTTPIDVVGQIGLDPGAGIGWTGGTPTTATADQTLRRRCSVTRGDPNGSDAFDPSVEWTAATFDDPAGLGDRNCP